MVGDGDRRRKWDTHFLVGIMFAASLALGDYGIRFYVNVLQVDVPHQFVAGVTEPLTTKLVPAVLVVGIHKWKGVSVTYLRSNPYWFGFVGGISLGIFERVLYVVVKGATISIPFLIAPLMHALNAVLIAGVVFSSADRFEGYRYYAKLLAATIVAMGIHLFWNGWGVYIAHGLVNN